MLSRLGSESTDDADAADAGRKSNHPLRPAEQDVYEILPGNLLRWGNNECDLTKMEAKFLEIAKNIDNIPLVQVMYRKKKAVWNEFYNKGKRIKISKFLSRLSNKLNKANIPLSFSLRAGADVIDKKMLIHELSHVAR